LGGILTSGYNNVTPGTGKGFLYVLDAMTGTMLSKISTGIGGTCVTAPCAVGTDPSGLGKMAAWADNFAIDNTTKWDYAGDLEGYVWKFDLSTATPTVKSLGQAKDSSGKPQPITTQPALGLIQDIYRVIFIGTGRYLGNLDLTDPATQVPPGTNSYQQSFYAFKDTDTNLGNLRVSGLTQQTLTETGTQRIVSSNTVNWNSGNGWFIDFNPGGASPGERVTVDPQLILGTVVIPTNVPNQGACSLGGDSWLYQVDYATGSYLINQPGGVVGVKLQGQLVAGVTSFQLGNGTIVLDKIGRSAAGLKEFGQTNPGGSSSRRSSGVKLRSNCRSSGSPSSDGLLLKSSRNWIDGLQVAIWATGIRPTP
jgi:type IV pilus assembly protein PilY1